MCFLQKMTKFWQVRYQTIVPGSFKSNKIFLLKIRLIRREQNVMFCRKSRKFGKSQVTKSLETRRNISKIEHTKLDLLGRR